MRGLLVQGLSLFLSPSLHSYLLSFLSSLFVGCGQAVLLQTPRAEALPKRDGGKRSLESVEEAALGDERVHVPVSEKSNGGGWSPARKTDPGAVFFSKAKLTSLLGGDPAEKGFREVRKRKNRVSYRGYWAKKGK